MKITRQVTVLAAALILPMSLAAGPAEAASRSTSEPVGFISAGNGTAGISQTVSVYAPKLAGTTVEVVAWNSHAASTINVKLNARGQGGGTWIPQSSGTWTVGASGSALTSEYSKVSIAAVPTVTSIFVPDKGARFQPMGLISVVEATDGTAHVQGKVTFYEANLGRLGEVAVDPLPGERALANFTWTPPAAGNYAFWTEFEPANDEESGTPATQRSVSGVSYLPVTEHPVLIQLLMPPVMRVGKPTPVVAQLPDIYRGTVSLVIDGREVSAPKETEGGLATFEWTPTHTGLMEVELSLLSSNHERLADVAPDRRIVRQMINVQPRLLPNPISVTPVVNGVPGAAWADGDILDYPAGARIPLVTSTGNGAAVTVEQRGACLLNRTTLVTPARGGGCTVTFKSPGDAKFASNSATVIVTSSVGG